MGPEIFWQVHNFVQQCREIWCNKYTNTFRFSLILLFWRSIGLWCGEEVIVEPGGATRGDGVGHGGRARSVHLGKYPSSHFTWLHPTRDWRFQTIFESPDTCNAIILCERFDATEAQFRDIQNRCKSALLQPPLRQVFKTSLCCWAEEWTKIKVKFCVKEYVEI